MEIGNEDPTEEPGALAEKLDLARRVQLLSQSEAKPPHAPPPSPPN